MKGVLAPRFHARISGTGTLESESTGSFAGEHAGLGEQLGMDPGFAEDETEKRWQHKCLNDNIVMGCRTMILWTCVMIIVRTTAYWARPLCLIETMPPGQLSLSRYIEYGFLGVSLIPLVICLKTPRASMYIPIVVLHFIYLLGMNLPPYSYSCEDLFRLVVCDGNTNFGARRRWAAEHLDCTLQGHTSQQMCMTWLLITPRVIPRLRMMHFVWIWILIGYLGVTIWYRTAFDEKYFPEFDISVSIWFLSFTNYIAYTRKFYLEKWQRNIFMYDMKQKEASQKVYCILDYMVPDHVIMPMLFNPGAVIADPVERASILFIMICDFEEYSHSLTPENLLRFLNAKFSAIDSVCTVHKVQKIETVAEEYVAAIGVVPADQKAIEIEGYPAVLGRLIAVVDEILRYHQTEDYIIGGNQVRYKLGMHTGPIVAGVIGQKLPRFRLFGDTINTAARMMQKGLPGELMFGEETKKFLPDWVKYTRRGHIEMKGKGKVMAYLLDKDSDAPNPRSSFVGDGVSVQFQVDTSVPASRGSFTAKTSQRKSLVDQLFQQREDVAVAREHLDTDPAEIPRGSFSRPADESARRPSNSASQPGSSSSSAPPVRAKQEVELTDLSNSQKSTPLLDPQDYEADSRPQRNISNSSFDGRESVRKERTKKKNCEVDEDKKYQEETQKFEKLLEQVKQKEIEEKGDHWRPAMKDFLSICPNRQGFTEDMEKKWFQWYHKEAICKKLATRLDRQALGFSVLFAIDTFLMVYWRSAEDPHDLYGESLRFPVFLMSRGAIIFIVMSWRVVAAASENSEDNWVMNKPWEVQMRILASYLLIGFLMFISYDAMTVKEMGWDQMVEREGFEGVKAKILDGQAREKSIYSLWFVPIFFIIITSFQLLFAPSCCFIGLAGGLMLINYLPWCRGLYFSNQGKFLFLLNSVMNAYLARTAESTSRSRFKAKHVMELSQNRIETILNTLLPPMVVEDLRNLPMNAENPTHVYKFATIAQSDLCGFTKLASTRKPEEVVKFIGELFGLFDELTDRYEIYKVETVGDAYIAGQAEAPLTSKNKPINVLLFGLDMVKATHEWSRSMGENVSCRVGVHSGECIGGIVGTEMQRYHLFGGLMRGLEVLESTAPEGRVQVSQACKAFCEDQMRQEGISTEAIKFEARADACLKTSKGEEISYDEVGGGTFTVRMYSAWYSQLQKQNESW